MATYYVTKAGNDTTGDGSIGNPWLTISKAYTFASTAIGHTINVGDGTYAENMSSSGRLNVDKSFAAECIIQSLNGDPNLVIITSTSGTDNIRQSGAIANTTFRNVTIQARTGTQYAFSLNPGTAHNITALLFDNVRFIADGATSSSACVGVLSNTPAAPISWGITWRSCSLDATGGTATFGLRLSIPAGSTFTPLIYDTATTTNLVNSVELVRCTNFVVSGGDYKGTTGKGILIGVDSTTSGSAGNRVSGSVYGCKSSSATGHGMLIGGDAYGVFMHGVVVQGGDHGLVIKNPELCTVSENLIYAGTINAVLEKGPINCTISRNTALILIPNNGNAVLDNDDGTGLGQYITSGTSNLYNRWIAGARSKLIAWSTAKNGSGNTFNGNIFEYRSTLGTWGDVLADADVRSVAEIQAAFAAGGVPGAEANGGTSGLLFTYRHSASNVILYANIFNANGDVWNGTAFAQYSPSALGALATYAIPMAENPLGSYVYSFVWNRSLPMARYTVRVFSTSAYGTFSVTDALATEKIFDWPDPVGLLQETHDLAGVASQKPDR